MSGLNEEFEASESCAVLLFVKLYQFCMMAADKGMSCLAVGVSSIEFNCRIERITTNSHIQ